MNSGTLGQGQDNEPKQGSKTHCLVNEKVCRNEILDVVLEENAPRLRWRLPLSNHVLRYSCLRDLNSQLQLEVDFTDGEVSDSESCIGDSEYSRYRIKVSTTGVTG